MFIRHRWLSQSLWLFNEIGYLMRFFRLSHRYIRSPRRHIKTLNFNRHAVVTRWSAMAQMGVTATFFTPHQPSKWSEQPGHERDKQEPTICTPNDLCQSTTTTTTITTPRQDPPGPTTTTDIQEAARRLQDAPRTRTFSRTSSLAQSETVESSPSFED